MRPWKSLLLALCTVLGSAAGGALAQTFPSRPITMIVPFAAGGPGDTRARILAEHMRGTLGQPVVVENVTGAGGSIGVGRVAQAPGDGYTLSVGNWSTHVVNPVVYSLKYDVVTDFEPVGMVTAQPLLILANSAVPANDLKGLIAWLKANPGKPRWAIPASAVRRMSAACCFRTAPARASSSCPIADRCSRCRT